MKNISFIKKNSKYPNAVIYLVILVLLNVVGIGLFKHLRLDLTKNKSFTISKVSKDVVGNLNDPLRVKIFFSKNLPPQYASIERYLRDLMPEYAARANRYFNYTFYDCTESKDGSSTKNKDNIKMANDFGVREVQVQTIEKDEVKVVKAYMGLVIQHGDMIERMSPIESTERLEYKITHTVQDMISKISILQGLEQPIKAKLFLSSQFQKVGPMSGIVGLDSIPGKIKEGIKNSNKRNFNKVKLIHYVDFEDEKVLSEAKILQLKGLSWRDFQGPNGELIKAGTGYAALVLEHGDKNEILELLDTRMVLGAGGLRQSFVLKNLEGIEEQLNGMVDNLLDINEEVGYLNGKGNIEINPTGNLSFMDQIRGDRSREGAGANFKNLLSEAYIVKQMTMGNIDYNVNSLIVAGAKEEFSEYELFQIDQYLMRGRSLVLFHDGLLEVISPAAQFNQNYQPPTYNPNNSGLEKLLAHYGLTIKGSYVFDEIAYEVPPQQNRFGGYSDKQVIKYAPIIEKDRINGDLSILANLKRLIMVKNSPLEIDEEKFKKEKITYYELFNSSLKSWEATSISPFVSPTPPEGQQKKHALGYILEGEFSSYFADKGIPEESKEPEEVDKEAEIKDSKSKVSKRIKADENAFIKKGRPGKIIIIGSSELIKNEIIDEKGRGPNAMLIMNLIDYANDKIDWAVMRSKTQQYNPIEPYNEDASFLVKLFTNRQNLKYFNIFGLPLIVGLSGFFVFYRRKNQKKLIQNKFL